jgi:hypothetical protein
MPSLIFSIPYRKRDRPPKRLKNNNAQDILGDVLSAAYREQTGRALKIDTQRNVLNKLHFIKSSRFKFSMRFDRQ